MLMTFLFSFLAVFLNNGVSQNWNHQGFKKIFYNYLKCPCYLTLLTRGIGGDAPYPDEEGFFHKQ